MKSRTSFVLLSHEEKKAALVASSNAALAAFAAASTRISRAHAVVAATKVSRKKRLKARMEKKLAGDKAEKSSWAAFDGFVDEKIEVSEHRPDYEYQPAKDCDAFILACCTGDAAAVRTFLQQVSVIQISQMKRVDQPYYLLHIMHFYPLLLI